MRETNRHKDGSHCTDRSTCRRAHLMMPEPTLDLLTVATELRRAAVNYFDHHGERCQGDDCNRFATWMRNVHDYPASLCDSCIKEQREIDKKATSKGSASRGEWTESHDAALVRELAKAVSDSKPVLD